MMIGAGFIGFGYKDIALYMYQTGYLELKNIPSPDSSLDWIKLLGLAFMLLGISWKVFKLVKNKNAKLDSQRIEFRKNFKHLHDIDLEDGFKKLFGVPYAGKTAIYNVLSHPEHKNLVLDLFIKCNAHLMAKGQWFDTKGNKFFFKLRTFSGKVMSLFLFVPLCLTILMFSVFEYLSPGISSSGPYAFQSFLVLLIISIIASCLVFKDISDMASSLTFVDKYKP